MDFYRKVSFIAIIVVLLILVAGPFLFKFYQILRKVKSNVNQKVGTTALKGGISGFMTIESS